MSGNREPQHEGGGVSGGTLTTFAISVRRSWFVSLTMSGTNNEPRHERKVVSLAMSGKS